MEVAQSLEELAAQHGGVSVSGTAAPPQAPAGDSSNALLELARQHGATMPGDAPTFRTSNEKDAAGDAVVDPNTAGTFFRHLWDGLNPVNLGQLLPWPKAAGGSGLDHPLLTVVDKALEVKKDADRRWAAGDKVGASAKYVESLIPLLGPMMSHWGDELEQGKYAAAAGDMGGFTAAATLPAVVGGKGGRAAAPASSLTAEEAAANTFGEARGVPLDAATATGSRTARALQKRAANSMGGETTATETQAAQAKALGRVGEEIAGDVHPVPVTTEQAGAGVESSIRSVIGKLREKANNAYGKLRELEDEAEPDRVPATISEKARATREQSTLGYEVPPEVRDQLKRIHEELDMSGYEGRTWVDRTADAGKKGNAAGGDYDIVKGHAGAPVYGDILDAMPGTGGTTYSRGEVQTMLRKAIETGEYNNAAKGALSVAERRVKGSTGGLSPSIAPPDAGQFMRGPRQDMSLAVDMTDAKTAIRPMYDRLTQENKVAPLQGGKAETLRALDRVLNGPDHAPLSVAEAALGDLKSLARADDPQLRSQAQGMAAKAVSELSGAIDLRAASAGDDVFEALQEGRAATRAKYKAADVLDQLRDEPVAVYRQMTAPKDAGIKLLRRVQELAPEHMPAIGRAKLEEWLDSAGERGRFDHADRMYAEWQKLYPETKRILFGNAKNVENLDRFFLLAKRIAENPNPSGTAHTLTALNVTTQPLMYGLAKLLYTPRGVRALTRLLEIDAKGAAGKAVGRAASQAAWLDLAAVAKQEGVPLAVPRAADRDDQR